MSYASRGATELGAPSCCRGGLAGVAPFPTLTDLPPGPDRAAFVADMEALKARHGAVLQAARGRVRPDGTIYLQDVQDLPGWPEFVADLADVRRRHAAYVDLAMGASSSVSVAIAAGAVLLGGGLLLAGARRR